MQPGKLQHIIRRIFKILAWVVLSIICLFLLVLILIQLPSIQNAARKKIINLLENKIGTPVKIAHLDIDFPKLIVLEGVYLQDQNKDTLLAGKKLKIDISLFKLLHNTVEINEISLEGIAANIKRDTAGKFNFDYIIHAFSSQEVTKETPGSIPMVVSLDEINLDKIRIKYHDDYIGYDARLSLNHFDTNIKNFDTEHSIYSTDDITLEGVNAVIRQFKSPVKKNAEVSSNLKSNHVISNPAISLSLGNIDFTKIKIDFRNDIDSISTLLNMVKLHVEPDILDITNKNLILKQLSLQNTTANIVIAHQSTAQLTGKKVPEPFDSLKMGWTIAVKSIELKNNHFVFNNNNKAAIPRRIDYSHLDIRKINIDANDLYFQNDSTRGIINNLSLVETSGLDIKKLRTDFMYTDKQAYLKNLYIETPGSKIKKSIALAYPSVEIISKDISQLKIDADITGSEISLKDILYFAPTLTNNETFSKFSNQILKTNIILHGSINNLIIPEFEVTGLSNTSVKFSGRISGMPNMNYLLTTLDIADLKTSSDDIRELVPAQLIPGNISIPSSLSLNGFLKGNMQNLITGLNIRTSYGDAGINANISNLTDSINASYNARVILSSFNIGKLIMKEDEAGPVSLNVNVTGKGYTLSNMSIAANGQVTSAQVKGYDYENLLFDVKGTQGIYDIIGNITDPNINANLSATVNLNGKTPGIKTTISIDSLSLLPLHFTNKDVRIHSKIKANFPQLDIDNLVGTLQVTEMMVNTDGKRFRSDTISIKAARTGTANSITLNSPIITAGITGKFALSGIGPAVQSIVNHYYHTAAASTLRIVPHNFSFYVSAFNSPFLGELIPGLTLHDSIVLNGNMNTDAGEITVNGKIPALQYGKTLVSGGNIKLYTNDTALAYSFAINNINGTSLRVPEAMLKGSVINNTIHYNFSVHDYANKEKYLVAGNLHEQNGSYLLSLLQNGLKLDYTSWNVNPRNVIEFGKAGIRATGFQISNGDQQLLIASESPAYNAPISLEFNHFKIESLAKIAEKDSLLFGGLLSGKAILTNPDTSPLFETNLIISNFNYKKDTLGQIVIKANNYTPNSYNADIAITGNGNSIKANGIYYTTNSGNFDFDVLFEKVNLASIESFTGGKLKEMSGAMEGRMKITGNIASPKINGNIDFIEAKWNVAILNSVFSLQNERVSFRDDGIHFNNFTIRDSANNEATIQGAIYTNDYRKYSFNVNIDADNFRTLNSREKDNPIYYGTMYIDTHIRIRGDMDKPQINADLRINDKTSLTIVLPQSDPQVAAREGIVAFFNQDHPEVDSVSTAAYDSSFNLSSIKGLDIVSNIEIDKNADFSFIVDEANGDFVKIKGEANLSGSIDPSGNITLTGTYTLHSGSYEMSFNMLKRRFIIRDGSTITWNGEPTSANIDVTAVYVAKAAPIDLVERQLIDTSATIKNTYKQKIPFDVLLFMKGELLKPDLTFDIVLPDKKYTVSNDIVIAANARLAQIRLNPDEMNKQVFALLLLNRFVAEDPFASSGGSANYTTLAKQSVSSILSDQLNRLAADLVQGVDINFGLETTQDYTTGQQKDRTDLNVDVSKRLLNERLNVSVGSNFELEGPTQTRQKTSNIAGNIQVDYKLTKDGGLMLRGYRIDHYEVALQGQVIETGLTFIMSVDYDKFKEILERRKEKKTIKKQLQEEQKQLGTDTDSTKTQLQ